MDTNTVKSVFDGDPSEALWYGLFVTEELDGSLDRAIELPHVTFGYGQGCVPDGIDWDETYDVLIAGYANDGVNEGYRCEIPVELEDVYFGADVPHITLSVSDSGKPVDTRDLPFEDIDPFFVSARFGYFSKGTYFL